MITDEERQRRIDAAMAVADAGRARGEHLGRCAWMSFVGDDDVFRGVVVAENVYDMADAIREAHRAKANPGGQVSAYVFQLADAPPEFQALWAKTPKLTCLSREELEAIGHEVVREGDIE